MIKMENNSCTWHYYWQPFIAIVLYHFYVDSAMPWLVCKHEGDEAIALPANRFTF